ncbi:cupin domain-containing protein [Comamonas testosteroni]|uniref:cupin domain-containing protein n=1 Tax=Comamonas testosteroni TaxID=285 RepID=UPI00389AC6B3
MLINADFSAPATVTPDDYRWVASPQAGVERVMLDRVGGEVARATSLVRYAEGSTFPTHQHPGGEEILVIDGVFSDEQGDYPAGWYLRNPPGSAHRPHSIPGALILVKLYQMRPDEDMAVRVNTSAPASWKVADGRDICMLFDGGHEQAYLEKLVDMAELETSGSDGVEVFVLSGALSMGGKTYGDGSWLRLPTGTFPAIHSLGASTVFVKTGHFDLPEGQEAFR